MVRNIVRNIVLSCVVCIVCVVLSGCKRLPPPPEGLPELHPCKIAVTFGGEAIEGVAVTLIPEDPAVKWRSGGRTDRDGVVELKTSFAYAGVPVGKYRVGFDKTEHNPAKQAKTVKDMTGFSVFPIKYRPDATQETIEVVPGKNEFVFTLDGGREQLPIPKVNVSEL